MIRNFQWNLPFKCEYFNHHISQTGGQVDDCNVSMELTSAAFLMAAEPSQSASGGSHEGTGTDCP